MPFFSFLSIYCSFKRRFSFGLFFSRPRSEGWPHRGRTFYRAMLRIRGTIAMALYPSVCLCLSVTSRSSTKMAKHRIT